MATISLDSTVIVSAEAYPEKKGFASFPEQPVTEITLAVTGKENNSQPIRISEVVAGKVLLELPDQVFLPNTTPQPALRGAGVHDLKHQSAIQRINVKLGIGTLESQTHNPVNLLIL